MEKRLMELLKQPLVPATCPWQSRLSHCVAATNKLFLDVDGKEDQRDSRRICLLALYAKKHPEIVEELEEQTRLLSDDLNRRDLEGSRRNIRVRW